MRGWKKLRVLTYLRICSIESFDLSLESHLANSIEQSFFHADFISHTDCLARFDSSRRLELSPALEECVFGLI